MTDPLTIEEENLLKDLLQALDNHPTVVKRLARSLNLAPRDLEHRFDVIWKKLQNGRLTVVES